MTDWIPTANRLPEAEGFYEVKYGKSAAEFYGHSEDSEWFGVHENAEDGKMSWFDGPKMVTHWRHIRK
jgi:hypothetical protein